MEERGLQDNVRIIFEKQRSFFQTDETKDVSFRIDALNKLKQWIQENETEIMDALKKDLNKSPFEAYTSEIGIVLKELSFVIKNVRRWAKRRKVRTSITHVGSKSYIYPEPYGVALIIAPWNYPFQLSIAPLIGAIAAGNCAIIKPSELTPNSSAIIAKMVKEVFSEQYISVIEGDKETSSALLQLPFDKIFFTGSVAVGKIVMEAASKHLTPVTLELGGKSPCIIHEDANIKLAAKRVAWGKFLNAGQTCIAPDYVYVHEKVSEQFLQALKEAIHHLYGREPLKNEHYTRIVSKRHYERLRNFLTDGYIFSGGKLDEENRMIEPTIVTNVDWNDRVMTEEIFGPILPILQYRDIEEIVGKIRNEPTPLALYLFTGSKDIEEKVVREIPFGGGCMNDTVYHFVTPFLPFGGKGHSGMEAYHGKNSFDAFSHKKSVLIQTTLFDLPFRYPNIKKGLQYIKLFLK